ncbi:MAG TPA: hypothetical protein VK459_19090 [Polyangiaceae bacterium]|nr:hypothetical protein [Polyangiaceae bacterium]
MSEKNEKDPTAEKKKLKISKEAIEDLKDEDLDKATGGDGGIPPYPRIEELQNQNQ